MSPPLVSRLLDELAAYEVSGATIHVTPDKALPSSLVTKLVKARLEENEAAKRAARRK